MKKAVSAERARGRFALFAQDLLLLLRIRSLPGRGLIPPEAVPAPPLPPGPQWPWPRRVPPCPGRCEGAEAVGVGLCHSARPAGFVALRGLCWCNKGRDAVDVRKKKKFSQWVVSYGIIITAWVGKELKIDLIPSFQPLPWHKHFPVSQLQCPTWPWTLRGSRGTHSCFGHPVLVPHALTVKNLSLTPNPNLPSI